MRIFDMHNRVALITGGGTGIGKACAKLLAEAGAQVFLVGRRKKPLLAVQQEIGAQCQYVCADLSTEAGCEKAVEGCIAAFGKLDILINNAGSRGAHGDWEEELSTENIRSTLSVDLESVLFLVRFACPYLKKSGKGVILNIASLAALRASGPIVYSAAKGAIRSLTKTLAKRLGSDNIRVNTIYPGLIITEMNEKILEMPEMAAHYREESPLNLLGEPEDIGWCVLYLSSDAAKFVTGQDFIIDGGAMCG